MKTRSIISVLLIVVMVLLVLSLTTACKPQNLPADDDTTIDTTVDTISTELTTENTTAPVSKLTLGAKYNALCAYDEQGEELSLQLLYGSSFLQYGGSISFNTDGTFSYSMGVSAKGPSTGTYEFISDEEIKLLFDSDKESIVKITEIYNDNVISIKLPENDYYIVFTLAQSE